MRLASVALLLLILAGTVAAQVGVDKINYKGWPDAYRIHNDACELVIVPQVTRVMSFALADGKNVLWENPELAGKTFPADDGTWHNIGGEKLWPTQQKDLFKKYTGKNGWPPPWPWDAGPSTAEPIEAGVRLMIPHDKRFGAHALREFVMDAHKPLVHVRQWIDKTEGDAAEMTLWTVCQVDDPLLAIVPRDQSAPGYRRLDEAADSKTAELRGAVVTLAREEKRGLKIGVGPAADNGWAATTFSAKGKDGAAVLFVQSHRLVADGTYPDGKCQAELYTAPVTFARYTEMELLSPLVALKPGQKLRDDAVWQLTAVEAETAKDAQRAGAAAQKAHADALGILP
jgi:hypothetical protein